MEGRGYESIAAINGERAGWVPFLQGLSQSSAPLLTQTGETRDASRMASDHNAFMTFGYVLALSAQHLSVLKVLDYGGSLGAFYHVARALMPDLSLEYHCKELTEMVRAGQEISPQICWHTEDTCFDQQYDLVMLSGSLQYVRDWQSLLAMASKAARAYVYLTAVPVVENAATYVAIQRHAGSMLLNQQFNKNELLETLRGTGLRLIREFWLNEYTYVANAPEQPSYYGCLLQRQA